MAEKIVKDSQGLAKDLVNDCISRQAAIEAIDSVLVEDESCKVWFKLALQNLPSAQPEQAKMIKEIRKWINSKNRGSADYFIIDKIEEIINKYEE